MTAPAEPTAPLPAAATIEATVSALDRAAVHAKAHLAALDEAPVRPTTPLETLRARFVRPLPDEGHGPRGRRGRARRERRGRPRPERGSALLRVRDRRQRAGGPRRGLADERLGPERRAVRDRPGRGGRRGDGRRLADRPVRPARDRERRLHDGRDDGVVHGARGGPPRAAREGRLGRRAPGPVRGAGDPGRGQRRVARHDLRGAPDAGHGSRPRHPRPDRRPGPDAPRRARRPSSATSTGRRSSPPRRATSTPARSTRCRRSSRPSARTAAGSTSTARSGCGPRADPARRHLVEGVGDADSWTTDAHKWLNVPYDSGLSFVRDAAAHHAAMTLGAAYYVETAGGERDPYNWVPESSRRARGFAVWAALRSLGRQGVAELIARNSDAARRFAAGLEGGAGIRILNDVVLNQVLVRFEDPSGDPAKGDARTAAIVAAVQEDGEIWLGGTDLARPARDADLGLQLDDDRRPRGPRRGDDPAPRGGDPDGLNGSLRRRPRCAVMAATPRARTRAADTRARRRTDGHQRRAGDDERGDRRPLPGAHDLLVVGAGCPRPDRDRPRRGRLPVHARGQADPRLQLAADVGQHRPRRPARRRRDHRAGDPAPVRPAGVRDRDPRPPGPEAGRDPARRHEQGVLHAGRRRGDRERDQARAPPHRPLQAARPLPRATTAPRSAR